MAEYKKPQAEEATAEEMAEFYAAMQHYVVPNDARFCSDFCPNWMAEERGEELRPCCTMLHKTLMGTMEKAARDEKCKRWFK